jgi:hypothetical protein
MCACNLWSIWALILPASTGAFFLSFVRPTLVNFSKKERSQIKLPRFCALAQVEYSRNFGFKRHFPIHKIFERGCEIGLWRITASRKSTAVQPVPECRGCAHPLDNG